GVLTLASALWSVLSSPTPETRSRPARQRAHPLEVAPPEVATTATARPSRVRASGAWAPSSPDSTTAGRLRSWFDDSGYTLVSQYTGPITDPDSLEQVKSSRTGRARRAIDELRGLLDRLPAHDRTTAAELRLGIGACYMYEGKFTDARREFQ